MSSTRNDSRRFLCGAHAIGLAGRITHPDPRTLSPTPSTVLSVAGGHEHQRVERIQFNGMVSADAATVQVAGAVRSQKYSTLLTASIEKLNILDFVTADRIVARLASEFSTDGGEASVYLAGSTFQNLRIAGRYVQMSMDEDLLSETLTLEKMRYRARQTNTRFEESNGVVYTSLVRGIDDAPRSEGWRIDIPEFGSVYLGELFVSSQAQRLTMLRVELGCAIEGTLIACELDQHWTFSLAGTDPTRPKG
jgi:hypothetical protein